MNLPRVLGPQRAAPGAALLLPPGAVREYTAGKKPEGRFLQGELPGLGSRTPRLQVRVIPGVPKHSRVATATFKQHGAEETKPFPPSTASPDMTSVTAQQIQNNSVQLAMPEPELPLQNPAPGASLSHPELCLYCAGSC